MAINVLLVDDSPIVRAVMGKALRISDLPVDEVLEAGDGREALAILRGNWVDVVFADIHMPEMNGVEMVEAMCEDDLLRTIPVIVVSTEGSTTRMEHLMRRGVKAYLRKPITPEQIRRVVQEVVGHKLCRTGPQALADVFRDTVERIAFSFPEPAEPSSYQAPVGEAIEAAIEFSGPLSGDMRIAAPRAACVHLAACALGLDRRDADAEAGAAEIIEELLNVTCGHVLTSLAGEDAVFDVSQPRSGPIGADRWEDLRDSRDILVFEIEGSPVLLAMSSGECAEAGAR